MKSEEISFAKIYCEQNRLDPNKFTKKVLGHCFHFPTRWFCSIIISINPDRFEADFELISHCGTLKSGRALEAEIRQFNADYRNRKFWRGLLRQRVSTHRLRKLFRQTLDSHISVTKPPFTPGQ